MTSLAEVTQTARRRECDTTDVVAAVVAGRRILVVDVVVVVDGDVATDELFRLHGGRETMSVSRKVAWL